MADFRQLLTICGMLLVFVTSTSTPQADDKEPPQLKPLGDKIRLAIIGDSTAASYSPSRSARSGLTGWGQVFAEWFNDRVTVLNHAASGRSSKSFRAEQRWEPVLKEQPDFVFIQFGHNDQKGKGPERETDPETTYAENLTQYINEAREAGIRPVLVTPVARRTFENDKLVTTLTPYVEATKQVGRELDVPVIDLHAASFELFEKLGDAGGAELNPTVADRTHFSRKGALAIAKLVAERVPNELQAFRRQR